MLLEWMILPGLALLLFLGMLALEELGCRSGKSRGRRDSSDADRESAGTGAIDAAVFALLGLILAFQFSGAASRLDVRRTFLVQESNAIGTAYLRLDLLPSEDQPHLREMFRRYLDTRIAVYQAIPNLDKVRDQQRLAAQIQGEIWRAVVKACDRKQVPGVNVLMLPALNEMIDITTTRDVASVTHGSWVVAGFMFGICLLAALIAGRAMARAAGRPLFHMIVFPLLAAITVYVILDLEYPRLGLIRIGITEQALFDLRQSMQ
jgi:hypothetical protein